MSCRPFTKPVYRPRLDLMRFRWRRNLSQHEAAAKVGCSQTMWQLIESGAKPPGAALGRRIARITKVPFSKLRKAS